MTITYTKVGQEFRVNTHTAGDQIGQVMAALADGGYVIAWQSDLQDGSSFGIYAQAYNADGSARGGEVQVNSTTANSQAGPKIVPLVDGGYVIAWQSSNQDFTNSDIYMKSYDADGGIRSAEVLVNSYTDGIQRSPQIAVLDDGGYVFVWESNGQDGAGLGIYRQAYDADGTARGGEARVNSFTANGQSRAQIAALADGGYVITWQSDAQDTDFNGVYAQAYSADGTAIGDETQVNTYTTDQQTDPVIAPLADGGYVISWISLNQVNRRDVYLQAFDADGSTRGGETLVNTYTTNDQNRQLVTALADGGYLVTWESVDQDAAGGRGVYAQAFEADGTARGTEFRVNTFTAGSQTRSQVKALSDGGYVIAWDSSSQDGSLAGVYAQAYDADGTARGTEIQVNSYTTDIQLGPQIAALADGEFIIAWQSNGQDGGGYGVYAQRFAPPNNAPTLANAIADQSSDEDAAWSFQFAANVFSDPDGDTLSYSAVDASDDGPLPGWLDFDGATRTFSGTPPANFNGAISIKVTASDGELSAEDTFTLTINAVPDAPTDITRTGGSIAENAANGAAVASFTGVDPDGGALVYSLPGNAGGRFAIDSATGALTVANGALLDFEAATSHQVTVRVTDGGGLSYDESFTINLTNVVENQAVALTLASPNFTAPSADNWTVTGTSGANTITLLGGADTVHAGAGADALYGGAGNDVLRGEGGPDKLYGQAGNDTLEGGDGNDTLSGGDGIDTATYATAAGGVTVSLLSFTAQNTGGAGSDTLAAIENLTGSDHADVLTGNSQANVLTGRAGNDTLTGNAGNDGLYGGDGDDLLDGGAGNDTLSGGNNIDTASYALASAGVTVSLAIFAPQNTLGAGTDTLAGIENLTGSAFADTLTGNGQANVLLGGNGDDTLSGGNGNDRLDGGAGQDSLTGGANADRFTFTDAAHSTPALPDAILDFDKAAGDRIDLSAIDAVAGGADDAFSFLAGGAFDATPGRLIVVNHAAGQYRVEGDIDGNNAADFAIVVTAGVMPDAGAFIL